MTSKESYSEAFVWLWLPDEIEPVVAGKVEADNDNILFNYVKSYSWDIVEYYEKL